jgi:HlyD family secretion protein
MSVGGIRMMWMRRNKRWFSLLLVLAVCGAGVFLYLDYRKESGAEGQKELTVKVTKGNLRSSVTGTAQLQPKDTQIITAPSEGTVKKLNLTRNMDVKAGDVLVEISSPTLDNNLQKAKVSLAAIEKELQDVQTQMGKLETRAPISGRITLGNNIEAGMTVTKTTRIATVADNRTLTVSLPFALEDAVVMKAGDSVELTIDGFMLTKSGTVNTVGTEPRADQKGGKLVDVEVSIDNDATMDAGLKASGTVAAGNIVAESKEQGTLQYSKNVNILAGVSGGVEQILVKTGQYVKAGDLIATIINDTISNDLATKQNSYEQQLITVKDLEEKIAALKVKAPFDGVFSTDFVNSKNNILTALGPGAKVTATTQFGGVSSLNTMLLPVQVDELDLPSVKVGMKAEVKVDSLAGRIFNAEVTQVSTVGTTTNGVTYFDVVLAVSNAKDLKYGMTATGEILFQNKENVLLLPIEALQRQRNQSFVSLKKADGTVVAQHPVQIGIRSKTQVEITSGLNEGDEIIVPIGQNQTQASQAEIDKLRQQFQQQGANGQGGAIQISPEDAQRLREQFQQSGGQGGTRVPAQGGTGSGAGTGNTGNTGNNGTKNTGGTGTGTTGGGAAGGGAGGTQNR